MANDAFQYTPFRKLKIVQQTCCLTGSCDKLSLLSYFQLTFGLIRSGLCLCAMKLPNDIVTPATSRLPLIMNIKQRTFFFWFWGENVSMFSSVKLASVMLVLISNPSTSLDVSDRLVNSANVLPNWLSDEISKHLRQFFSSRRSEFLSHPVTASKLTVSWAN